MGKCGLEYNIRRIHTNNRNIQHTKQMVSAGLSAKTNQKLKG